MPGTQRLRVLRRGIVAAVCLLSTSVPAHGQRPAAFVRLSPSATPRVSDPRVLRQQRVDIASLSLLSAQSSSVLQLDFFADVSFRAVRERVERTGAGTVWIGSLDGYPHGQAVFVAAGDELLGHVYAPFGFFRVERHAGSYVVQQAAGPPEAQSDLVEPPRVPAGPAAVVSRPAEVDDEGVIDLLIAYTRDAFRGFETANRADAAIDLAVAETNEALSNTGVRAHIRVVHRAVIEYEESGDYRTDLARLLDPADGFLDSVIPLRDEHAADLVALITNRLDDNYCGAAYLARSPSFASFGWLSVTKRGCLKDYLTLAHEIGHNLGAVHDWYDTPDGGAYVHAKGHVSIPGRFRDVMSSYHHCYDANVTCARMLYYSNPALRHLGLAQGVPIGTNTSCTARNPGNDPCDADLAQTFSNVAPLVAKYRDSRTALSARRLRPGESFRSQNGQYRLTYQADGNLVLYDDVNQVPLWGTNTGGRSAGQALLQMDGNFVVSGSSGEVQWTSGTAGHPRAYLAVQNDGNLVIYSADGRPLWGRD